MKRRILAYLDYIDNLLERDDESINWEDEVKKHLVQIAFFAHERQVHLIVMALFALAAVITVLYLDFSGSMIIFALVIAIFVLLIPYINHYYLLENSVQRMYVQYDKMMEKLGEAFKVE
jgi:ABC-type multidrug transport system fused ATPase/permease subunit